MANRVMQQKTLKIKNQRKRDQGFLPRFSQGKERKQPTYLKFGKSWYHNYNPTAVVRDDAGKTHGHSLGDRSKAARGVPDHLDKLFPTATSLEDMKPDQIYAKACAGNPRAKVLVKLMQGPIRQKEMPYAQTVVKHTDYVKITLFMRGPEVFFIKELVMPDNGIRIRKSLIYTQADHAMMDYKANRIRWSHPTDIPSSE